MLSFILTSLAMVKISDVTFHKSFHDLPNLKSGPLEGLKMGLGSISQAFWRRRFCFYSCRNMGGGNCPLPPPLPRLRRPWKLYGLCYGFTKSKNTIGMYKVCWQVDTNPNWVRKNLLQGSIHILRKYITFLGLWTHHHHTHVSLFQYGTIHIWRQIFG